MRSALLCCVALLCAAGAAQAQGWPAPQGYYPNAGYSPNGGFVPGGGYAPNPEYYGAQAPPFTYSNGFYHFQQYTPPEPGTGAEPREWPEGPPKKSSWVYASFDYLFAKLRTPDNNIPLVSQSNSPAATAGAIGVDGTQVLYNSAVSYSTISGVRGELGVFLDCDHTCSVEGIGLWLLPAHERFAANSDPNGVPGIYRPVFDVVNGIENAVTDARPGFVAGGASVDTRSELFGFELNGRYHHCLLENQWYVDCLAGFRYLRYEENLTVQDQATPLVGNVVRFLGTFQPPGATISDQDTFLATNKFYGGQVGARMRLEGSWWLVHVQGKCAVGVTDQDSTINGFTRLVSLTSNQLASGGVLAQPSNIGTQSRTLFGVVPEGDLNVGFKIHNCVQLTVGYSFLYWTSVLRSSGMIDRNVNFTQVPTAGLFGPTNTAQMRPAPSFNGEPFWVQALSVRLAFAF